MNPLRGTRRRAIAAAGLLAGAVLGVVAGASPAHAATPLSVDLVCFAEGASQYDCLLDITGGTAPYSSQLSGAPADGTCRPRTFYRVTVVVTDSAGAQASDLSSFICRGGPPIR